MSAAELDEAVARLKKRIRLTKLFTGEDSATFAITDIRLILDVLEVRERKSWKCLGTDTITVDPPEIPGLPKG